MGWGNNYEDAYTTLIGKRLVIPGKKIEILNLGTPAQPIGAQLCWFQHIGYRYKPDMILQTIYGYPNVIESCCSKPSEIPVVKRGYLYHHEPTLKLNCINLSKNSAIVFYGWYFYQSFFCVADQPLGLGIELNDKSLSDMNAVKLEKEYLSYIEFINKLAPAKVPVVFIFVPFSYVVRPKDVSRWKHLEFLNPTKLQERVKQVQHTLEKDSVLFIDPTDELIEHDRQTRMYYFLDIHFTPAGNKAVAEKAITGIQKLLDGNCCNRN
jgi:hypothetical protein